MRFVEVLEQHAHLVGVECDVSEHEGACFMLILERIEFWRARVGRSTIIRRR